MINTRKRGVVLNSLVLALVVSVVYVNPLGPEELEHLVLYAHPEIRIVSHRGETKREVLEIADRLKNRVEIVKIGRSYFWKSRENRQLIYNKSNIFHTLVDPRGGGWVKVGDQRKVPEALRILDGPEDLHYFESVSSGLFTITYWGTATAFDP